MKQAVFVALLGSKHWTFSIPSQCFIAFFKGSFSDQLRNEQTSLLLLKSSELAHQLLSATKLTHKSMSLVWVLLQQASCLCRFSLHCFSVANAQTIRKVKALIPQWGLKNICLGAAASGSTQFFTTLLNLSHASCATEDPVGDPIFCPSSLACWSQRSISGGAKPQT